MTRIDVDERSADRGKHLVDLLADGLGHEPETPADAAHLRAVYVLGGVAIALLFTAVTTVLVS